MRSSLLLLLLGWMWLTPFLCRAQVNIESMRKSEGRGFQSNLAFNLGYISGNSEIFNMKTNLRSDLFLENYNFFIIGNYQRATSKNKLSLNKGFVHVRGLRSLNRFIKVEVFTQKEFNDFLLIKNRDLLGSGLRFEYKNWDTVSRPASKLTVNLGTGVMWERELFNKKDIQDTRIIRSTNYLSLKYVWEERLTFQAISYYQVNTKRRNDYRILSDGSLGITITKQVMITTGLNFRYDNEPPIAVKKYDMELTNGLLISF